MEFKLEYIVATAAAVVMCGPAAPGAMVGFQAIAEKIFKNISPKIRKPIERTVGEAYGNTIMVRERVGNLFHPDILLMQQYSQ